MFTRYLLPDEEQVMKEFFAALVASVIVAAIREVIRDRKNK